MRARKTSNSMNAFESGTILDLVKNEETSLWHHDVLSVLLIALLSFFFLLVFLYAIVLSPMKASLRSQLTLPTSLAAAQVLSQILSEYAEQQYFRVVAGHAACYLFLQTFAIPGTVFFNLLAGALFGLKVGFPLCLLYNTLGSICLYLVSSKWGGRLFTGSWASKLTTFQSQLDTKSLTWSMTCLRLFPMTPNWFMNVASPHLHIDLRSFAMSIFVGLAPYNFLSCQAGLMIRDLKSQRDIMNPSTTVALMLLALLGLILPKLCKRQEST